MTLTIMVTIDEDGFYIGQLKEFPEVISEGETEVELLENIQDALTLHLEYLRDKILANRASTNKVSSNKNDSTLSNKKEYVYSLSM